MDDYLEFQPKEGGEDAVVGVSSRKLWFRERRCVLPLAEIPNLVLFFCTSRLPCVS